MNRPVTPVEEIDPIILKRWDEFIARKLDGLSQQFTTARPDRQTRKSYQGTLPIYCPEDQGVV